MEMRCPASGMETFMLLAMSVMMPSMMNSAMPKVKVPSASANSPFFICSCESILSLKNSFSLILCLCKTIVSSIILQFLFDVIFRNRCFGNGGFECKGNKNA